MDPVLHLVLRACLALLLGAAARHKVVDMPRFRAVLEAYRVLPARVVPAAAAIVVALEGLLALLLATGIATAQAGLATAALMAAYGAAIHANVRRGRTDIDCGCTGPAARVPLGHGLVVRNAALAMAAVALAVPVAPRALGGLDAVAAVAAVATLAFCWLATQRMLALAPRAAMLRRRTR